MSQIPDDSNTQITMNLTNSNPPEDVSHIRINPTSASSALRFTRDIIDRRTSDRTRNWRDNLHSVFREIRPLAQSVNNSNILSSWMSNQQPVHQRRVAEPNTSTILPERISDSFVINFDGSSTSQNNSDSMNQNPTYPIDRGNSNGVPDSIGVTGASSSSDNQNRPVTPAIEVTGPGRPQTHHHHHHHHHHSTANNSNNQNNDNPEPVAEAFAQIPEARAVLNTLSRYTPYICILLAKSMYDHLDGILDFFALFITFSHANWVIRQEIAKQSQKRTLALLRELLYIVLVIAIIGFMLEKKNIFISLMFASSFSDPFTLRNLLFSVGITDLILKLITVGIKILITLLPPTIIEYKGRGRIYLMVESVSQLYRALAPIQPWLVYLLDSYSGSEKIMGVLLSAAYMVAKGSDLLNRVKFCKRSFIKLLQKVSFGVTPTKEQLQTAGGQCPICHDDYNTPVLLECTHIFCELCVGTWFDREQTCPLCRAKVVDDPSYRDGATTFFNQFY